MVSAYPIYVARNPDQVLAYPHWTDGRWREPRLIYGQKVHTETVNYSDRLWQWDYEAAQKASEACKAQGLQPRTARWDEAWLSAYHGRPVALRWIMGGTNWSSGCEYYIYGYDYKAENTAAQA